MIKPCAKKFISGHAQWLKIDGFLPIVLFGNQQLFMSAYFVHSGLQMQFLSTQVLLYQGVYIDLP